jgi:hypothetical protein
MSAIKQGYAKYSLFKSMALAAPQTLMSATWHAYNSTTQSPLAAWAGLQLMLASLSTGIETAQLELSSHGKLQHTQQLLRNQTGSLLYTRLS